MSKIICIVLFYRMYTPKFAWLAAQMCREVRGDAEKQLRTSAHYRFVEVMLQLLAEHAGLIPPVPTGYIELQTTCISSAFFGVNCNWKNGPEWPVACVRKIKEFGSSYPTESILKELRIDDNFDICMAAESTHPKMSGDQKIRHMRALVDGIFIFTWFQAASL